MNNNEMTYEFTITVWEAGATEPRQATFVADSPEEAREIAQDMGLTVVD